MLHRRAQDDSPKCSQADEQGNFSLETAAIAITALLGLGSYILQAKMQRDADTNPVEAEQRCDDNVHAQNKVERLLAREQVGLFTLPFSME
jgi:hypothetical protein